MITNAEYASLKAIAKEGSLNSGAKALGISVYRLRQHTTLVEKRLGIALVDHARGRGGVSVTDALVGLLDQYEAMEGRIKDSLQAETPVTKSTIEMRLGIMPTIGPQHVMSGYRRVGEHFPVNVTTSFDQDPIEMMRHGSLDGCLMAEPTYPKDFARFSIAIDPFLVAFPQGHALEKMSTVTLEMLDEFENINRSLCEFPRYLALKTGVVSPVASPNTISDEMIAQSLISEGAGVAIVPESLVLLQSVCTRRLTRPAISRTISVVAPKDGPLAKRLLEG